MALFKVTVRRMASVEYEGTIVVEAQDAEDASSVAIDALMADVPEMEVLEETITWEGDGSIGDVEPAGGEDVEWPPAAVKAAELAEFGDDE